MRRADGAEKRAPTEEEYERRLAACERAMLRLTSDYQVASEMVATFGVGRRAATEWCRKVRERWRKATADVSSTDHTATKAEARARFVEIYRLASGGVWSEPNPDDPASEPKLLSAPNMKVANDAAIRLAQLDGHLTAKGVPVPPPEVGEDPIALEVRRGYELTAASIREAGGLDQFLAQQPTMPSEDDMNPRAAVRRKNAEIAKLQAELDAARQRLAGFEAAEGSG